MTERGYLLRWNESQWDRWSSMPRLSLTAVPRTKFLLLKAPLSTVYEEKYGDRNVFTVPMYVQRLIAKGIAVGLVIDCTSLDLKKFHGATGTLVTATNYYIHNANEWDDFGIDYHKLVATDGKADTTNDTDTDTSDDPLTISPKTIKEFLDLCVQHWKDNPTMHISLFDGRGGNGAASFLAAYYLCHKFKAPVHTALSLVEKASPSSTCEQKGLYDIDLLKELQEAFKGKTDITLDNSKLPSWWFAAGDDDPSRKRILTIPAAQDLKRPRDDSFSMPKPPNKKVPASGGVGIGGDSVPMQVLSPDSQRYIRAMTVIKQLINAQGELKKFPIRSECNLNEDHIQNLQGGGYKVTWRSKGRRGLLLVLSDGIYFLENMKCDSKIQVSILTCPLYIPNPQKPSMVQHRTLLDVTLVMDREKNVVVPRFLVSDILIHMGATVMHKPFTQRLKFLMDGVIIARKKTANIWNYQKEKIRMRAKEFFELEKAEFVCSQVVKAQLHDTDGIEIIQSGGQYAGSTMRCASGDDVTMRKLVDRIKTMS